jgi:hypothetical protein
MKERLTSLDVFRGMTIMFMTIVNNPGDWGNIYAPLEHAEWYGCTPTDLVFPFFLFIGTRKKTYDFFNEILLFFPLFEENVSSSTLYFSPSKTSFPL